MTRRRRQMPPEYSMLLTATLCLLAFGAVMVFSASSTTQILGGTGDGAFYFKRTVIVGIAGLVIMRLMAIRGTRLIRGLTPVLMLGAIVLLLAVLIPGVGNSANGSQRWIGSGGFFQVQPSELAKLALVLYSARLLAAKPETVRNLRTMVPILGMTGLCCVLVVAEPDLGTAMVTTFAVGAMLVAAGAKLRHLAFVAACVGILVLIVALAQPYMRERLFGFLHPGADAAGTGFQAAQAKIALGSGGIFGVGLGQGVQKAFYLPEAHTDMIAAVIGEEVGFLGIGVLVGLFSMFGYAGMRTAQKARGRYEKLLVAGLTSLIMGQAIINLFAVMGLAPVTGVPLPFVSYGNSSLIVSLAAAGLILNVARAQPVKRRAREPERTPRAARRALRAAPVYASADGAAKLRLLEGGAGEFKVRKTSANSRNSRGGHGRTRRAGDRRRRRPARQGR